MLEERIILLIHFDFNTSIYMLPPRQAVQHLYSRFVSVHGLPGHNVAADLHMEHLNVIAKGCVKALGANKTEAVIQ